MHDLDSKVIVQSVHNSDLNPVYINFIRQKLSKNIIIENDNIKSKLYNKFITKNNFKDWKNTVLISL